MLTKKPRSFTDTVRLVVAAIPKGTVMTYQEVASKAGNPKAARAVARIMSTNFDEAVPCHRVIRSDGGLGGYNRGGVEAKRARLVCEGWNQQPAQIGTDAAKHK